MITDFILTNTDFILISTEVILISTEVILIGTNISEIKLNFIQIKLDIILIKLDIILVERIKKRKKKDDERTFCILPSSICNKIFRLLFDIQFISHLRR